MKMPESTYPGGPTAKWNAKWATIDKLNTLWDKLTKKEQNTLVNMPATKIDSHSIGEWSRHAKQELKTYEKDTMQPYNKDGTISKKFVGVYGTESLKKETGLTDTQIREEAERYG